MLQSKDIRNKEFVNYSHVLWCGPKGYVFIWDGVNFQFSYKLSKVKIYLENSLHTLVKVCNFPLIG